MSNDNSTKLISEFIANTRYGDLPKEVVNETKRIILDSIGCMVGGYPTEIGKIAISYVRKLGGNPQSTIVGLGEKTSCINAAYANGKVGNALDYDDTFPTPTHVGIPSVAAALSLCEMAGKSGEDLITAVAVGFEVSVRFSMAFGPFYQVEKGKTLGAKKRHGASASKVFAATASAAKALGQESDTIAQTLAVGGGNCPVATAAKWSSSLNLPMFKYADVGWCAQTGVSAALLAGEGYTGYEAIFDGDNGFWFMFGADQFNYPLFTQELGRTWFITDNSYKLWPICRQNCYVLTGLEEILKKHRLNRDEIKKIVLSVNPVMMQPRFRNQEPTTQVDAQFSVPHSVAVMLLGIPKGPLWQSPETRNDPAVSALRRKVEMNLDPRSEKIHESFVNGQWRKLPTAVEVITTKGEKFRADVDYAQGDGPWAPTKYRATNQDLETKYRDIASCPGSGLANDPDRIDQSVHLIWNLEKVKAVSQLTAALSPRSSI